jgi:hypothetical protein
MARISTYSTDPNITADDKWIGTDFNTQYTKNFTPQYLADFFNVSNSIGVSGQVSFKYYSVFPSGFRPEESITTQTVDPSFSSITSLKIHKNSGGGKYCVDFVNYLSGDEILVSDTSNANIFGHFKLNSVTQDLSETNFYNLSVTYIGGNGNLQHLKVYSIALYSMDIIDPTLQSVTDAGNTTTNAINALSFVSNDGFGGTSSLSGSSIDIYDATGAYLTNFGSASSLYLSDVSGNSFSVNNNTIELVDPLGNNANISISGIGLYNNASGNAWSLNYPTKPNGYVGTFAMLNDIPATPNLQTVTGVGANTNISITVEDTTLPLQTYSRLSKGGLYVYTSAEQSSLSHSQLSLQRGGTVVNTLSIEPGGISRNCNFFLPSKTNGNYILATTSDSLLTEFTFDSYTGVRLKPSNLLGNGFYFERNANESVGYSAVNTNTGNGAVALNGVGIDTNPYIKNISLAKFGPNYYVPLLAGKGGILSTEEVFLGSRDGNDVSILTGADITTLSRKFTVKANGQLQIQTTPTTGTTSDKLLVRDTSGNVKQIDYPTGYVPYTGATSDVNLGVYGLTSEYLQLNTTPTTYTPAVGRIGWNDTDGTLEFKLKGNNVTLQIGQEQVIRVVNKTTPLINLLEANYQVCVIAGAQGQRVSVRLAQADNDANSAGTLGVVTETINANQEGFITTSGQVKEINTTGSLQGETWADGDILYLSPTTAGAITNIKPIAPNHTVIVGYVEYAHAIHGKIFVKIDNGYELNELHNVKITGTPANNNLLAYTSSLSVWENKTAQDAGVLTIAVPTTTGVVITFVTDRLYGSIASPETGNITADVTNAQIGVTNIIVHNSGTAPTFGAEFKKLSGSGNYVTSVVNYIYCTYINATEIIYSINQRT